MERSKEKKGGVPARMIVTITNGARCTAHIVPVEPLACGIQVVKLPALIVPAFCQNLDLSLLFLQLVLKAFTSLPACKAD
jgi:hypothetical protein